MDLAAQAQLLARATLEDDGVRFHYEFRNRSTTAYDMISAVTDPRLTSIFHDERLERTYLSEITILVARGSLADVRERVAARRASLQ